jgi:hypothetical protein
VTRRTRLDVLEDVAVTEAPELTRKHQLGRLRSHTESTPEVERAPGFFGPASDAPHGLRMQRPRLVWRPWI